MVDQDWLVWGACGVPGYIPLVSIINRGVAAYEWGGSVAACRTRASDH